MPPRSEPFGAPEKHITFSLDGTWEWVYEGLMDFKIYERITLNNLTHGKVSLDRDDSQFGKLQNLWRLGVPQSAVNAFYVDRLKVWLVIHGSPVRC